MSCNNVTYSTQKSQKQKKQTLDNCIGGLCVPKESEYTHTHGRNFYFLEIKSICCLSTLQAMSLAIFEDIGWRDLGNLEKHELDNEAFQGIACCAVLLLVSNTHKNSISWHVKHIPSSKLEDWNLPKYPIFSQKIIICPEVKHSENMIWRCCKKLIDV